MRHRAYPRKTSSLLTGLAIGALLMAACDSPEGAGTGEGSEPKAAKEICVAVKQSVRVCCPAGAEAKLPEKELWLGDVTHLPPGDWCKLDGKVANPVVVWQDKTRLECPAGSALKVGTFEEDEETGPEHYCESGGVRVGNTVRYHATGAKRQLAQYVDGKLSGETTRWHENDAVEARGHYADGGRDGTWTHFDDKGNKTRENAWRAGKRHGTSVAFWDNGNRREELGFEDGVQHGPWTNYWYEGGKQEEGHKDKGRTVGQYTSWWGSGQMATRGEKVASTACGTWECWKQDGSAEPCWEGKKPDPDDKFAACKSAPTGATCPPCDKVAAQVDAAEAEAAAAAGKEGPK